MRTLSIINLSIKDEVIPHIVDFIDLMVCWNKLKNLYESNKIVRRLMFRNHIYNIKMEEGANMEEVFLEWKTCWYKLEVLVTS
jgi:hypothetical protein